MTYNNLLLLNDKEFCCSLIGINSTFLVVSQSEFTWRELQGYSRKTSTDQKRKVSETLGKLIPLNSGCTTIDKNEAVNFKKQH
jgi:hypothetical protein